MSKILVSCSSMIFCEGKAQLVSFYEGFVNELMRYGNNVLLCNTAEFLTKPWNSKNEEAGTLSVTKLKKKIQDFAPDYVFAFNNSKFSFIEEICDCPIFVCEADSFMYYNDKDKLITNKDRYHFICNKSDAKKLKKKGIKDNKIVETYFATAFKAESVKSLGNISFIGSNFKAPDSLIKLLAIHNTPEIKATIKYLADNFEVSPKEYLSENNMEWLLDAISSSGFSEISSAQNRLEVLSAISRLGLELFGTKSWLSTASYAPNVALSYNDKQVYSLKHTQNIYNGTKVGLNISHTQAVENFPWRVLDIMASNSCLLSNNIRCLNDFTKEFVSLPTYTSSAEAYELAQKLLSDEEYRKDLILGSQACVEAQGRWIHRFSELESAFGISLIGSGIGSIEHMNRFEFFGLSKTIYSEAIKIGTKVVPKKLHWPIYSLLKRLHLAPDYQTIVSIIRP